MKTMTHVAVAAALLVASTTGIAVAQSNPTDKYHANHQRWAEARAGMKGYEKPTWLMTLLGIEDSSAVANGKNTVEAAKTRRDGVAE